MTDIVDLTLRRWRQSKFIWGKADCMLSIGDYIAERGGKDVTGIFRGTYTGAIGAIRHMRQFGGVAGLIGLTGIERIDGPPQRGDVVALVSPDCEGGEIGAICTGDTIAARQHRGVVEVQTRFVRLSGVWRCPQ